MAFGSLVGYASVTPQGCKYLVLTNCDQQKTVMSAHRKIIALVEHKYMHYLCTYISRNNKSNSYTGARRIKILHTASDRQMKLSVF